MFDYCVIGGGIVGMATAMSLLEQRPGASLLVLEKEDTLGRHQTGHNSGVIHSGIYYTPGSLKAALCRRGAQATKDFCADNGIPVKEIGKLLVSTNARESDRLLALKERAVRNEIDVEHLTADELRREEPAVSGVQALLVPSTAIVDYRLVTQKMRDAIVSQGGHVELDRRVVAIEESTDRVAITTTSTPGERNEWQARQTIICGGVQADRLAALCGFKTDVRIVPFRGEYYALPQHRAAIVNRLVYPVPDPDMPFLGVHLTPMIDGRTTVGPNAVLGLSREGYRKGSVDFRDVRDILSFPGFWRVARTNVRTGIVEMKNSLMKRGFLEEARKYCPELDLADLLPYEAGIRAQAVHRDGTLLHDFLFLNSDRILHVLNAPSPAATAAIPIGRTIAERCTRTQTTSGVK